MCGGHVDLLRDRPPAESYTIVERLNVIAGATAEWADQSRSPSSSVVAEMGAKDIRGGMWRRFGEESQPMWDDVYQQQGRSLAASRDWNVRHGGSAPC